MLEKIISLSIRNKWWVMLFAGLIALAGVWSALRLPLDAVPDITNKQVQIITSCPSLAAQEVEQYMTAPIEKSLASLPKVTEMRSISRFGLSVVTVVFSDDADIYFVRQLVTQQLKQAEQEIPAGVGTPELAPVTTGLGEIFQYVVHPKKGSEHKYTAMDLRTLQDWVVARQLYGTKGVAEVNSFGGFLKQYEVAINPERLKALGVSLPEIFAALSDNNQNTGGAYIDKKPNAYFIRGIGALTSMEDIRKVVVRANPNGTPLLIGDVATVQFGNAVRYGGFAYNGEKEAVGGMVLMLRGENSFDVVHRVKEKLKIIQKTLPEDVLIEPYLDRTNLINRAIFTVEKNLVEGALIVIFVLVVFLGNLRAGLIVASAIPLSMLFALWMMHIFGVSANLMSLGAIDFGLIVDGAVIIVEAAMHYIFAQKSKDRFNSEEMDAIVQKSASKMMSSAVFGQVIILIVYLPILSLQGIEGKMFAPMAQTVGFAIVGALLLSLTYIPVMCAWFLPRVPQHKETFADKLMGFFERKYTPVLEKAILYKKTIVGAAAGLLLFSVFLFSRLGGEFIPTLQEGDYTFDFILPQGASLSQSIETSMQAARILRTFPEVKTVIGKTGTSEIPMDVMPTEGTDLIVVLKEKSEWKTSQDYWELGQIMTKKLQEIPGVFVEFSQPIQMRFNDLMTGVAQDVAVKIFGEDLDTLAAYAEQVGAIIQSVEGAGEPKIQRITGLPQISVQYDRARMAQYGVSAKTLNQVISTAFAGEKAGVIFENERRFDLVVRLDSSYRKSIRNVEDMYVPLPNGAQVPLSQLAKVDFKKGPAEVGREHGKRRIVIGFNLKGRDVQSVVQDLQAKLDQKVRLPVGYYFTYGGAFENLQKAVDRLLIALPIALFLIYVLLYFAFHSMRQATLIFSAIPMSAIGGVFALLVREMPFSIAAGVGFIALFGVAVLNGIVLISTFNELAQQGYDNIVERVKEGTKIRLRPVLMTATVASLGFLPMAMSSGAGAEVQKPLATVVIGGLITATLLTLIVLPLLYLLFAPKPEPPNPPIPNLPNPNPSNPSAMLLIGLIFLGLMPANDAQAQKRLSAEEAIGYALQHNLQLKANLARVDYSKQKLKTAFELAKTGFFVENEDIQTINRKGILKIGLSQAVEFPTVYGARKSVYQAHNELEILNRTITETSLKKEIRAAYYGLWYAQNQLDLFARLDSLYTNLAQAAEVRVKAGESAGLEKIAANAQKQQIRTQKMQAEQSLLLQQQELIRLLNASEQVLPLSGDLQKLAVPSSVGSEHPIIQTQAQEVKIAVAARRLQKAQNLPDFWARGFYQRLYGIEQNPFIGFSVTMNVPLFSKPLQKTKLSSLEVVVQTARLEQQKQAFSTLQTQAKMAISRAQTGLEYFETVGLQQAEEIIAAASLAYRSGELSYAELAQYLTQAISIRKDYLDNLNAYNQAVIEFLFLINQ